MKTRAEIYAGEATALLREISLYPGITEAQLLCFHPDKEAQIKTLLRQLASQGRIAHSNTGGYCSGNEMPGKIDSGLQRAVWVLLDFIDRVEYHTAGEFPTKLFFLAEGELYEIIAVPDGQEATFNLLLNQIKQNDSRRIVLVDTAAEIDKIDFPDICGFCTVEENGRVQYYKKKEKK